MNAEVALIVHCAECDALWLPTDEERWLAYLTDDEPAEVVLYCPECGEREFGGIAASLGVAWSPRVKPPVSGCTRRGIPPASVSSMPRTAT